MVLQSSAGIDDPGLYEPISNLYEPIGSQLQKRVNTGLLTEILAPGSLYPYIKTEWKGKQGSYYLEDVGRVNPFFSPTNVSRLSFWSSGDRYVAVTDAMGSIPPFRADEPISSTTILPQSTGASTITLW